MKKSHLLLSFIALLVGGGLLFSASTTTALASTDTPQTISQTPDTDDIVITPDADDVGTQTPDADDIVITNDADNVNAQTPTITIEATKVICDTDAASPHWGLGATITATTASDYVAHSDGHCHLAPNWSFQWSDQSTNPINTPGTMVGEASGFTTFGTTDANGSVTTTVPFPSTTTQFHVREVLQTGYIPFTFDETIRSNDNSDSAEFYCETDGLNYDDFEYIRNPVAGKTYHCVAFNVPTTPVTPPVDTQTPSGGGGGGGTGGIPFFQPQGQVLGTTSGGSGGSSGPVGQVLGATTTCGEYITSYVQLGQKNDSANVTRLQTFLNTFLHLALTADGKYGPKTFAAVKQFQVKESDDVLLPWKNLGNPNLVGTGYVYKTTKRAINNIVCPSLNLPMPILP